MDDLIESSGGDAHVVDLSDAVRRRGDDPHWWQDPRNAVRATGAIGDGADEGGSQGCRTGARRHTASGCGAWTATWPPASTASPAPGASW